MEDRREMHEAACCVRLQEAQRQWNDERAQMKDQIRQQCAEAKRLNNRFKLLQTTVLEQQKVLNRYEKTLRLHSMVPPASPAKRSTSKTENLPTRGAMESPLRKRSRVTVSDKTRQSLPAPPEVKSATGTSKTSPERRRSLPERRSEQEARHATNKASFDSWRARKKDMHNLGGGSNRATDLLRRRQETAATSVKTEGPPAQQDTCREDSSSNSDSFFADGNQSPKRQRRKDEPGAKRSPLRTLFAASAQTTSRNQPTPRSSAAASTKPASSTTDKPNGFAYVEVVRNREERAALPGFDCIECRKYYEALDGLVPEAEMKAQCSRHRARYEPYQTPDDFWRLTFPDSPSQDLASP